MWELEFLERHGCYPGVTLEKLLSMWSELSYILEKKALKGKKSSSEHNLCPLLRVRKIGRLYPGTKEGGKYRKGREERKISLRIYEKSIMNPYFYLSKLIYVVLEKSICVHI